MTSHFNYLIDDEGANFFQKVAEDVAFQHEPTPFEKLARRLDTDLHMIKTAGPCGGDLPAIGRACTYLEKVAAGTGVFITPEQFGEVFDKVAAAAIEADVNALATIIDEEYPDGLKPAATEELRKLAADITSAALMEKEAIIGKVIGGVRKFVSGGRAQLAGLGEHVSSGIKNIGGRMRAARYRSRAQAIASTKKKVRALPAGSAARAGAEKSLAKQEAAFRSGYARARSATPRTRHFVGEQGRAARAAAKGKEYTQKPFVHQTTGMASSPTTAASTGTRTIRGTGMPRTKAEIAAYEQAQKARQAQTAAGTPPSTARAPAETRPSDVRSPQAVADRTRAKQEASEAAKKKGDRGDKRKDKERKDEEGEESFLDKLRGLSTGEKVVGGAGTVMGLRALSGHDPITGMA